MKLIIEHIKYYNYFIVYIYTHIYIICVCVWSIFLLKEKFAVI